MPFSGTGSLCSDSEDDPVQTSKSNSTDSSTTYCSLIGNFEVVSIDCQKKR